MSEAYEDFGTSAQNKASGFPVVEIEPVTPDNEPSSNSEPDNTVTEATLREKQLEYEAKTKALDEKEKQLKVQADLLEKKADELREMKEMRNSMSI